MKMVIEGYIEYDLDENGKCVGKEFIAGDSCQFYDDDDNEIDVDVEDGFHSVNYELEDMSKDYTNIGKYTVKV
jgi:hypothetical protein